MSFKLTQSELFGLLAPLRPYLLAAAGFSFFINILLIAPSIYMLQVYDRAVAAQSVPTLGMLTLILLFLLLAMGGLDWVRNQIMVRAAARLNELLADQVFCRTFEYAIVTSQHGGIQPLADLNSLRSFLSSHSINAFFDTPWVPVYVAIMFAFHTQFGVMAIAAVVILATLMLVSQRLTEHSLDNTNKAHAWATVFAARNLRNAEATLSMGMMDNIRARWSQHHSRFVALQSTAADWSGLFTAISRTLRIAFQSLALGLGAYLAINGEISPGMMIAGSILLGRALAPLDQLLGAWKGLQQARLQCESLDSLLRATPGPNGKFRLPDPTGQLSVESIHVSPPGSDTPVLQDISFSLAPGTALGIIGPSAAGKSALARAVLGLWPVQSGCVRLDGADICDWLRIDLGPSIGYLPQDIELFDGTIAENIARFGIAEAQRIVEAARLAGIHDMILRLPCGYDTVIGATGGLLAGGQRQGIGLARALYGNPKLIVLDEPNSNLDQSGEAALRAAIKQLKRQACTLLIITHRPSILSSVDQLLVMRDGTVADFGPASEVGSRYQQTPVQLHAPTGKPAS